MNSSNKLNSAFRNDRDCSFFENQQNDPGEFINFFQSDVEGMIDLNTQLVGNKPATFFVRVNSDSMKAAGIHKGDIAIVDRSIKPLNGKVVIVALEGEMLIRRLEKGKNFMRLVTDSNNLSPLNIEHCPDSFCIWGVVTYVIHKP